MNNWYKIGQQLFLIQLFQIVKYKKGSPYKVDAGGSSPSTPTTFYSKISSGYTLFHSQNHKNTLLTHPHLYSISFKRYSKLWSKIGQNTPRILTLTPNNFIKNGVFNGAN